MGAPPKVVALAGPTGAGKSTVAGWLAGRGAAVIDADRVGHELLFEDGIREAVVAGFGGGILGDSGEVDRGRLGAVVFAQEQALARLEAIVHPPLLAELARRIDTLQRGRVATLVVVDAALWFQWPDRPPVDFSLGITASRTLRLERVLARDGIDIDAAKARIARQDPIEASLDAADAVLDTAGAPSETRLRLFTLLDDRLGTGLVESDPGTGSHPSR